MSVARRHAAELLTLLGLLLYGMPPVAHAQQWVDEYAAAVSKQTTPDWEGPVVDHPTERRRPEGARLAARSTLYPLAVHATPDVTAQTAERALEALVTAYEMLGATGWPEPLPDGGRGGTGGFDLYLVPGAERATEAFADAPVHWSLLDAVSSFAVVDPSRIRGRVAPCITQAYAEAMLLGQDPAEAAPWRRATGAWLARKITGWFGCQPTAVRRQQRQPWRPWIRGGVGDGAGGALLLAMLSDLNDHGTGTFVRDVWQLARQNSFARNPKLRASPDVWMALAKATDVAGDGLRDQIVQLAASRWFAGRPNRSTMPLPVLDTLGSAAAPPVEWELTWDELSEHTPPAEPALHPFGSVYARVDVSEAPTDAQLRIWLRGEYGVQWSLTAVRLGPDGHELGRMSAPPRRKPEAYLPVLLDDTAEVLVVATNMSSRLPDADIPDENVRSVKLILDQGQLRPATGGGDAGT